MVINIAKVSEDGILIDQDILSKFSFNTYEPRVIEFGTEAYPLNLYQEVKGN